ncbi:MAG: ABC transporter ATP-binding protein [Sulfolobales archaeon]
MHGHRGDNDRDSCVDIASCIAGYRGKPVVSASARICKGLTCILGPNGSGKTTLLKTIAGLLDPIEGAVLIDGLNMSLVSVVERAKIVGIHLSQIPTLPLFKVRDVVLLGRTPRAGLFFTEEDMTYVEEAIKRTRIEDLSEAYFNQLSDGQKRRVMIAMALSRKPRVLLLDEPTSFLDPFNRRKIFEILKEVSREISVILSTHDIDLAAIFCDTIYYIDRGVLRKMESLQELGKIYGEGDTILDPFTLKLEPVIPKSDRSIHILGGCGSGTLYLRKTGYRYSVTTGPLYPNDLDAIVLKRLGALVITTTDDDPFESAIEHIKRAELLVVIDTPDYCKPPETSLLVKEAIGMGKKLVHVDLASLGIADLL